MHIVEEWRIRDVEQKAERASSRLYELDSLRSDVDSLEHSMRQIRSVVDGLRDELEACKEENLRLRERVDELSQVASA